MSKFNDYMK